MPSRKEETPSDLLKAQLIEKGIVNNMSEADALLPLILSKERKTGKYKPDAGHQFEVMSQELLDTVPGVTNCFMTSTFDDQKGEAVDLILCFEGGIKIAIQATSTESPAKLKEKMNKIIAQPVLRGIRDDNGKLILDQIIPKGVVTYDKKRWGEVLNDSLSKHKDRMTDSFINKRAEAIGLLGRLKSSLETMKTFPKVYQYAEIYDAQIHSIENSLAEMQKGHSVRA